MAGIAPWSRGGMRQLQVLVILKVPKVLQAAKMAPKYFSVKSAWLPRYFRHARQQREGVETDVEGVVHGGDLSAVGRVGHLRDEDRARLADEGRREAEQGPGRDKCGQVLHEALHDGEADTGDQADEEGQLTTESIRDVGHHDHTEGLSERVDGVHEPEKGTLGVSEEAAPLRQGLEAYHHGACLS